MYSIGRSIYQITGDVGGASGGNGIVPAGKPGLLSPYIPMDGAPRFEFNDMSAWREWIWNWGVLHDNSDKYEAVFRWQ